MGKLRDSAKWFLSAVASALIAAVISPFATYLLLNINSTAFSLPQPTFQFTLTLDPVQIGSIAVVFTLALLVFRRELVASGPKTQPSKLDITIDPSQPSRYSPQLMVVTPVGSAKRKFCKVLVGNTGSSVAERCKATISLLKWSPQDVRHFTENDLQLLWENGSLLQDIGALQGREFLHVVFSDERTTNDPGDYRAFLSTPDGIQQLSPLRAQEAMGSGEFEVEITVVSIHGSSASKKLKVTTSPDWRDLRLEYPDLTIHSGGQVTSPTAPSLGEASAYEPSTASKQEVGSRRFEINAEMREQFYNPLYIEIGRICRALENQTLPYRNYSTEVWMKFREDSKFRQMDNELRSDLNQFYDALARISELSRLLIRVADEALLDSVREDYGENIQMCNWQILGYKKGVVQGNLSLQPVEAIINGRDLIEHASILYSPMDTYRIQIGLQSKGSNEVPWRDIDTESMRRIFTRATKETSENKIAKEAREKELWVKKDCSRLHEELGRILDRLFQATASTTGR